MNPHPLARIALASALILANSSAADEPKLIPLHPGPETTVFEGPIRENGTVDFVAALNDHLLQDVASEENAFVDLAWVMPEESWPSEAYRTAVFRRLGVEEPPADAPHLVSWDVFAAESGLPGAGQARTNWWEADDAARGPDGATTIYERGQDAPWTAEELPQIGAWMQANEAALAVLSRTSQKTAYAAPLLHGQNSQSLLEVPLPQLGELRALARVYWARTNGALGRDDHHAAVHDLLTVRRWSRLVSREPLIISRLVGMSLISGSRSVTQSIVRQSLTEADARLLLNELDALPSLPPLADAIDQFERLVVLDLIQQLHHGQTGGLELVADLETGQTREKLAKLLRDWAHAPSFDPNAAMRQVNETFNELVRLYSLQDYDAYRAAAADWDERLKAWSAEVPFQMGQLMAGADGSTDAWTQIVTQAILVTTTPAYDHARATEFRTWSLEAAELAAIALAGYRAEHGRLPDTLDELVPAWLPEVPVDPFTGDAILYRRTPDGAVVYSVGENVEDDGGDIDFSSDGHRDLGFHIPAEPK